MKDRIELGFMYENEFGTITDLKKVMEYNSFEENELEMLVGEFRKFLICAGFTPELANSVVITDID